VAVAVARLAEAPRSVHRAGRFNALLTIEFVTHRNIGCVGSRRLVRWCLTKSKTIGKETEMLWHSSIEPQRLVPCGEAAISVVDHSDMAVRRYLEDLGGCRS
jgi:hypothetical protein